MLNALRKNHQFLMTIIVVFTIAGFIALYIRGNPSQFGSNDVLSVYGRVVQRAEIDRQARSYQLALALGLTDFVSNLGGLGENDEASLSNYILNLFIVQHQAEELGVRPTDDAVASAMKSLSAFETDGAFDPAKYAAFVQEKLAPRGFTERQLEDIIRDSLKVHSLYRIITSPVAVAEAEIRTAARIYQPISAEVLHFDREQFLTNASVLPSDVAAFYEKNKAALKAGEARSLSYVTFELPAAQEKLEGKERTAALQKLADDAVAASKSIRTGLTQGIDFFTLAEKTALHPKKAVSIQRDGSQAGKDSGLPQPLVEAVFRLQKIGEVSDVIQDGNQFFLVTIDGITPARQLELDEVKEKISKLLKSEKAGKAALEAATTSLAQIRTAMASGKSFADAARAAGVKVDSLMDIAPADPKITQDQLALASATLSLKEGELGQLQPAPWGAFAIYLEKRAPLSDEQWKEHQAMLSKKLQSNDQKLIFQEWLNQSRGAAQVKMLGKQRGGGA